MAELSKIKELELELKQILDEKYVLSSDVDLATYECDANTLDIARPDLVVLPNTTEEVQAIVRLANKYQVPFTVRGAATGLSGGATTVYGGISIVMTRMTKIIKVDPDNFLATVQVGVTNSAISQRAEKYGLHFAPDPSSQMASTIGGNIAENSGGPHTLKYGTTVNHILGLKIVTPDGNLISLGGVARDCLGLDLLGVFIGSEGTLGIACEATVKLIANPQNIETLLVYFPSLGQGGQAVSDIIASGIIPAAMEMIDKLTLDAVESYHQLGLNIKAGALLIVELDGPQTSVKNERQKIIDCVSRNSGFDLKWAKDKEERQSIWKARKSAFGALGKLAPHAYVLDCVIPRSKLAEIIEKIAVISQKYKITIANVYHAGDGNLHPALLYHQDNQDEAKRVLLAGKEIMQTCIDAGGTLSGEHGIGIEKLMEMPLAFRKADLEAMHWIHQAFNPSGLCNPGKVIPTIASCGESGLRPLLRHQLSQMS